MTISYRILCDFMQRSEPMSHNILCHSEVKERMVRFTMAGEAYALMDEFDMAYIIRNDM